MRAFTGRYKTHGDPATADCVIGFSFGYRGGKVVSQGLATQATAHSVLPQRQKVYPGLSNEDIADLAVRKYPDLPKIFQFEIADAYKTLEGPNAKQVTRIEKHHDPRYYLDSREVAYQAAEIMKKHGWKNAIIMGHPNHIPRLDAICKRLGINTIVTRDEYGGVEFDLRASQKWTRSIDKWRSYEPLVIMYYWLKGWV
jgi:hypothetical protein